MKPEPHTEKIRRLEKYLKYALRSQLALTAELHSIRDHTPNGDSPAFDMKRTSHLNRLKAELAQKEPDLFQFLEIS